MRGEVAARVTVPVPRSEVHAVITDLSLLPKWHRDVRRARAVGRGRSVWDLHGPTGPLRWTVETTLNRNPEVFAVAMRGQDMAGFMRVDLSDAGDRRTDIRMSRFLGIRGCDERDAIEAWWGEPGLRLNADLAHLVDVLKQSLDPVKPPVFVDHHLDSLRFPDVKAARTG